jgi:putative transposase
MIINKAYKFRLYPNKEQQELINKTLGCNRLVYNYYLNKKKEEYENNNKNISCFECIKDLLKIYVNYPFLKEIDSMSLRCSLFDLDNAYQKFFKEKIGYPKFKNKYDKNSYRTNYIKNTYKGKIYENIKLDLINRTITLPKLKEVKIRGYRNIKEIKGRIINATISKEKDNKYYVSVLFEEDIIVKQMIPTSIIGIDLGIKDLVITSNYEKYQNEKRIQKYEKRIKRKQKELSRKIKGSNNYYKTKQKLAKLYHKLTNARKYIIHKITKEIIDKNDIIVTENLKIKNMIKNHTIAKSLTDATLSEIIRQLEYKSKWKGKQLYKIDTYYPSSQICSKCGYQNKKIKDLKIREYICPECGSNLDRDCNAAENIMVEGIKKYMERLV